MYSLKRSLIWGLVTVICVLLLYGISGGKDWLMMNRDAIDAGRVLLVLVGVLSFIQFVHNFIDYHLLTSGVTNGAVRGVLNVFWLLFFPVYLGWLFVKPLRVRLAEFVGDNAGKKLSQLIAVGLLFKLFVLGLMFAVVPVWLAGSNMMLFAVRQRLNLVSDNILVSGTGSMYPTFPKGEGKDVVKLSQEVVGSAEMQRYPSGATIGGREIFTYQIGRGDIVSFYNETTAAITQQKYGQATGFIKRVIALPGDQVEIRNGIVWLNNEGLKERYTARAHSTFGGDTLPECTKMNIPTGKLLVMGDNRKGSMDSRHDLGLISFDDVDHVIPWEKQIGVLDAYWRDTTDDLSESSKIKLDKKLYLEILNNERSKSGAPPLRYDTNLEKSARIRGEVILEFNDFSFEATASGITMEKAMQQVGYSNIVWGEAPTQGYYDADELLENQLEFGSTRDFLLDQRFDEVGIAEAEGEINGCPTQVVVQHFAGYVPPNYDQAVINSWRNILVRLNEIQPGWEDLKSYAEFYERNRADIDRLIEIMNTRRQRITVIVVQMESNEWLTAEHQRWMEEDASLNEEQAALANRLNSQN